ncbi:hypothetical protein PYCC9005_006034 [Savitreella phatthalungensis]
MPSRRQNSMAGAAKGRSFDAVPSDMLEKTNAVPRRSSRAITKRIRSYDQDDLIHDREVFISPADREASPDQASIASQDSSRPSVDALDDSYMTDDSLMRAAAGTGARRQVPSKRRRRVRSSVPLSTPVKNGRSTSAQTAPTMAAPLHTSVATTPQDDGIVEAKTPTKADKLRAKQALAAERYEAFPPRPPTFDSDDIPVPFIGRLGYACLNTILRSRKEPIFCSRTTRIATIEKPDHGMPFVLELGRQNAADLSKIIEWNERHGIRFFRLSSEMFPFASHEDYLYDLEHADSELRHAGALCNKYNHRVTTHPGQFTQLASPNEKVIENAVRDLEYHNELLTRLRLDEQRDRDAVMVLHLGGAFGDKIATIERFKTNYAKLSEAIKRRIVLENDDMCWSVTDLLPVCQELNIPLVLDWHHHNIIRDEEQFREGTLDIMPLLPAIAETWTRKNIRQKMHMSEARFPNHPLGSQRRSHSQRIYHLPPCRPDMDLMLEAKDKEQAVFELSKRYDLDNPPVPPEVIGDGPGAKGDEAYWPEGQEARLKTTRPRVKKETLHHEEGDEIKTPKRRRSAKKTTTVDEDQAADEG